MSRTRRPPVDHDFHGGDLADAVIRSGQADMSADNWLDLSTGINPSTYPVPELSADSWTRLPGSEDIATLRAAAVRYYGAPDGAHIVPGPGSQALIQALPTCLPERSVSIVGPTYSGLAAAWSTAGQKAYMRDSLAECDSAGITVIVNPNNPDGRVIEPDELVAFAEDATASGGWLVVDEAFCDLVPELSIVPRCGAQNLVALRSFGKFFGLAGLRLGVAIATPEFAEHLSRRLGPWAVSGPALQVGTQTLLDTAWQKKQRADLHTAVQRFDTCLAGNGLQVTGGTDLFRLVETARARALFNHLLAHRIYVRQFSDHPHWLRFGIPGTEEDWQGLETVLREFAA